MIPSNLAAGALRCRSLALAVILVCTTATIGVAQSVEDIPTIRVETREVLIPLSVEAKFHGSNASDASPRLTYEDGAVPLISGGTLVALHLVRDDFQLFEDEKEQKIDTAELQRHYWTGLVRDNMGFQKSVAVSPNGEWTNLRRSPQNIVSLLPPFYVVSYRPPESPERSCHTVRIKVTPKDSSGHKRTTVESVPISLWRMPIKFTEQAQRSKLILRYRTEYCNAAHAASDPLLGSPASAKLEDVAADANAEQAGFDLSAVDFFDETGRRRIRIALDFPNLSDQTGIPGFQTSLLAIFKRVNDGLVVRLSDSKEQGARSRQRHPDLLTRAAFGRENFWNHYETAAELPPGDYDLRVAIDFGGALRRAQVPVNVRTPVNQLAVSGIALCRRYFNSDQLPDRSQLTPDGIPIMPFEPKPLVSKGIAFTPTGDTHFSAKDPLAAYFEVYEPLWAYAQLQPDVTNVHVQFQMRVVDARTGAIKSDTGFRPADEYGEPGKSVIPISEMVKVNELTLGDYQLQVRALDSAGNTTDWRSTSFTRE